MKAQNTAIPKHDNQLQGWTGTCTLCTVDSRLKGSSIVTEGHLLTTLLPPAPPAAASPRKATESYTVWHLMDVQ
jgi:hypothetical protein